MSRNNFLIPEGQDSGSSHNIPPRGGLLISSCTAGEALSGKVVRRYQQLLKQSGIDRPVPWLKGIDFRFSDGETCVRLQRDVNGQDVFLFQSLHNPLNPLGVDHEYLAFLIAARTFREWGANHVTGVLPYLAYARQDKPTQFQREPTTVELMADLSIEAGIDRLVVWHPHLDRVHGFYGRIPVDALSPHAMFVDHYQQFSSRQDVIAVAPDAGAAKMITAFARELGISSAVASKYRPAPEKAEVSEVMGDFSGKKIAILLDDMISTGGTVAAAVQKLVRQSGIEQVYLGISHNLASDQALERLKKLHENYHLQEILITDSIPQPDAFLSLPFLREYPLADPLSRVINRIHHNRSGEAIFSKRSGGHVD